ncbi:MAG: TlyA family RNA methyltransferase, partial [Spirochaetales bacterium]|nr:TlyA family RNA methyltransferase [Spirochaetales bacterium]
IWDICAEGKIFLDAGASTGGFTDCLLQHGAAHVFSVDVGWNQLNYKLRSNPKVTVMEKTNIMLVDQLDPVPYAAVADLSFRSLTGAANHLLSLTAKPLLVALIKPQFETNRELTEFNGVVESTAVRHAIVKKTLHLLKEEGVAVSRLTASPILGRKGNREYFALLTRPGSTNYPALSPHQIESCLKLLP